ncbi:hypothetical protein UVI_02062390 [Ustilaginoidea virens]|uniref:Uncharacterized protein n=1 Tax=Ustilaginoidea virens TaxID=1159556 RepID=A0A1B5L8M7_USTVR|nr:hypothetical protein UVI_02062390 [Ustilaginoidea virens]
MATAAFEYGVEAVVPNWTKGCDAIGLAPGPRLQCNEGDAVEQVEYGSEPSAIKVGRLGCACGLLM